MRNNFLLLAITFSLIFASCSSDEDPISDVQGIDQELENALIAASSGVGKAHYVLPKSTDFNAIPQDENNPITPVKVALGQLLYHETGIALAPKVDLGVESYSCATCHFASAGFQAGTFQAIAEGGIGFGMNGEGRGPDPLYPLDSLDIQPLRSPTTLNSAYQEAMLWNGQFGAKGVNAGTEANWTLGTPKETNILGYEGVEIQAIAGLKVHRMTIENQLCSDSYKPLFEGAFRDFPEENRITKETAGLAIAAYERTLLANEAPFQEWLKGDVDAMTEQEKRGAMVFFGKGNCSSCHDGPALNSMEFHAIGMNDLNSIAETTYGPEEEFNGAALGRGGFTGNETDNYKFKVPQLYNLADSPFYGHGSSFRSIREVIEYKNNGVAENSEVPQGQLAAAFVPLNLSEAEIDDLVSFISLSLRDPNLSRYEPVTIPSGNCFPNNDETSRSDLGCN